MKTGVSFYLYAKRQDSHGGYDGPSCDFRYIDSFNRKDTAMRAAGKLKAGQAWKIVKKTLKVIAESK